MPGSRRVDPGTWWLGGAAAVGGLGAVAIVAIGTRAHGVDGFAPVSIVWTVWLVSAAVLTFPVQHWTIREVRRGAATAELDRVHARLALMSMVLGVGLAVLVAAAGQGLLRTSSATSPLVIAILVATAPSIGHLRGRLVGQGRQRLAAVAIGGENLVRLGGALLVTGLGLDVRALVVVMALGPLVLVLRPGWLPIPAWHPGAGDLGDLFDLSLANSLAQVTLVAGPVLLAALAAPDATVSALFATLSLARAPHLVLLGASLNLTAAWSAPSGPGPPSRRAVWATTVVASAAVGMVAAVIGPIVVAAMFGTEAALGAAATGLVAAGSTLALGSLVFASLLTASGATRLLARSWVVAALVGVIAAVVVQDPLARTLAWFVVTEVVALTLLAGVGRARPRTPPGRPQRW